MSKELKLLIASAVLFVIGMIVIYNSQNNGCTRIEYQSLEGPGYILQCNKVPTQTNCWSNHSTEQTAIQSCEGK